MSKNLGDKLPVEILEAFDGTDIEAKIGRAYLLVTTDEDGTPRPCMLSAGEILVPDERRLRVALWPNTSTSRNLGRGSRTLFCYVAPGTVYYAKGRPESLGPAPGSKLERFQITITEVESDVHAGMPVEETILFSIEALNTEKVVGDWTRQLDALRA
jgi:hypothetical protein